MRRHKIIQTNKKRVEELLSCKLSNAQNIFMSEEVNLQKKSLVAKRLVTFIQIIAKQVTSDLADMN